MANDTLLLKTNKEPTFWNKEAAIGFFIAPILGLIIGGFLGKERMKREKEVGKPVSKNPGFWNKDTLLGGAIGGMVAGIAAGVAMAVLTFGAPITPGLALVAAALHLVPVAGMIVGGYFGGKSGQEDERKLYAQALSQQGIPSVQAPELSQDQSPSKSFAKQVEQERALAAAQVPAR